MSIFISGLFTYHAEDEVQYSVRARWGTVGKNYDDDAPKASGIMEGLFVLLCIVFPGSCLHLNGVSLKALLALHPLCYDEARGALVPLLGKFES